MAPYDSDQVAHSNEDSAASCPPLPDLSASYLVSSPPPPASLYFSRTRPPANFPKPRSCPPKCCVYPVSPSPSSFSFPPSSHRSSARTLSLATFSAVKDDSLFLAVDTPARHRNKDTSGQHEEECKDTRQPNEGKTQNDHICQRLEDKAKEVRIFREAQNSPYLPHVNTPRKYVYRERKCPQVLHYSSQDSGSLVALEEMKNNCAPGAPSPVPCEPAAFPSGPADETTRYRPHSRFSTSSESAPVSRASAAPLLPEATAAVERSGLLYLRSVNIPGAAPAHDPAALAAFASVPSRAAATVLTGAEFSSTSAVVHSAHTAFAADADNLALPSGCGAVPLPLPFFTQEENTCAVFPAISIEAQLAASFACRNGHANAHPGGFAYCCRKDEQLQRNRFTEEREANGPQDPPVETSIRLSPSLPGASLDVHRHHHFMPDPPSGPKENQQHHYYIMQQLPQCTLQVQPSGELRRSRQLEMPDQQRRQMLVQLQEQRRNEELLLRSAPELLPHLQTQVPLRQRRRHTVHVLTMHLCALGTPMYVRQNHDQVPAEYSTPQLQAGTSGKKSQRKHGKDCFEEECHWRGTKQCTVADKQRRPHEQEWQCLLQQRQQEQERWGYTHGRQQLRQEQQVDEEESTFLVPDEMACVRRDNLRLLSDRPVAANVGSGGTVAWLHHKADLTQAAVVQAEDTAGTARGFTPPGKRCIERAGQLEATRHGTVAWATGERPAALEAVGALAAETASAARIAASAGRRDSSAKGERVERRTTAEGKDQEQACAAPIGMCSTPARLGSLTAALPPCVDPTFGFRIGRAEDPAGCRLTESGGASLGGAPWIVAAPGEALAAEIVPPWAPATGSRTPAAAATPPVGSVSAAAFRRAAPLGEQCTAERLQSALDEPEEGASLHAWRHEGGMKGVTGTDKEAAAYAVKAYAGSDVLKRPAEALWPVRITAAATPETRLAAMPTKGLAAGSASGPPTGRLNRETAAPPTTDCSPRERRGCGLSTGQTVDLTDEVALEYISLEYSYDELYAATAGFSVLLGQGASGSVYKGVLRDGGSVAVKWLRKAKGAGFEREVRVLSKFRHPNLVILLGFGRHNSDRFLVYELLSGGDVGARLQKGPALFWPERLSVALDTACALSHLQHRVPQVYHRDIKTANILLDRHNCAKVADFGLACLAKKGERGCAVQQAAGTVGYADPRYITSSIVTERTEVYSFGMVLLELLTAKPPAILNPDGSITYLLSVIGSSVKRTVRYVDPRANFPPVIAEALARLAFECVQENQERRPSFRDLVHSLRQLCRSAEECIPSPLKVEERPAEPNAAAAALACAPLELLPRFTGQSLLSSQSSRLQSRECRGRSWAFTAGSLRREDREVASHRPRPVPAAISACRTGSGHHTPRDMIQPPESAVLMAGCVSATPAGAVRLSVAPAFSEAAHAQPGIAAVGANSAAAAAVAASGGAASALAAAERRERENNPSSAWVRPAASQKTGADAGEVTKKEIDNIGIAIAGAHMVGAKAASAVRAAAALGGAASEPVATGAALFTVDEGSEEPSRSEEAAVGMMSTACGLQHRGAAEVASLEEAAARPANTIEVLPEVFEVRSPALVDRLGWLSAAAAAHKRQVEVLSPDKRAAGRRPRLRGVGDYAATRSRSERRVTVPTVAGDDERSLAAADKEDSTAPADKEYAPAAAQKEDPPAAAGQTEEVKPEKDGRVNSEAVANHTATAVEEFSIAAAHAESPAAEERGPGEDEDLDSLTPSERGISAEGNKRADASEQSVASSPTGNASGGTRRWAAAAEGDEEGVGGRRDRPLWTTASEECTHKKTRRHTQRRAASRGEHSSSPGRWRVPEDRGNHANTLKQLQYARKAGKQQQAAAEGAAQESQQERGRGRNKQQGHGRDEEDGRTEETNKGGGRQETTGGEPRNDSSSRRRLLQLLQAHWRSRGSRRKDRGQPWSSSSSSGSREVSRREDRNRGTDAPAQEEQHESRNSSLRRRKSRRNSNFTVQPQPIQQPNRRRMRRRTARNNSMHSESGISDSDSADVSRDTGSSGSSNHDESGSDSRAEQPRQSSTSRSVQRRTSVELEVRQQLTVTTASTEGLHAALHTGALTSFATAAALLPATARVLAVKTAAAKQLRGLLRELQHHQKLDEQEEQQHANDQQQTQQQVQQVSLGGERWQQYAHTLQQSEKQLQQEQEEQQEPQRLDTQQQQEPQRHNALQDAQKQGETKQEELQQHRHEGQVEEQQRRVQEEHVRERHPAEKLEKLQQNQGKAWQKGQQQQPKKVQQPYLPEEERLGPRQLQQEEEQGSPPSREEMRQRLRTTQHPSGQPLDAEGLLMLRRTFGEYIDFEELSETLLLLWESLRNKRRALKGLRRSLQSRPSQDTMRDEAVGPEISLSPKRQLSPAATRSVAESGRLLKDALHQPPTSSYSFAAEVVTAGAAVAPMHTPAAAVARRRSDEAEEEAVFLEKRAEASEADGKTVDTNVIVNTRVRVSVATRAARTRRTAPAVTSTILAAVVRKARAATIEASPGDGTHSVRLRYTLLQRCAQKQGQLHQRQSRLHRQREQDKEPGQQHLERDRQPRSEQQQQPQKSEAKVQQDEYICNRKACKDVPGVFAPSLKETIQQQRMTQKEADEKEEDAVLTEPDPARETQQKERVAAFSRRSLNTQELLLREEITELEVIACNNDFSQEVVVGRSRLQQRLLRQQQQERELRRQRRQEQRERHRQQRQLRQLLWLQQLQEQRTLKRQQHQKRQQEKQQQVDTEEAGPERNASETNEGGQGKKGRRLHLSTGRKLQWKCLLLQMTAEERQQIYSEAHRLIFGSDNRKAAGEAQTKEQKQGKQQNVCNGPISESEGKWVPPTEAALAALGDSVPLIQLQEWSKSSSGALLLASGGGAVSGCSSSIPDSSSNGERLEVLLLHAVEAVDPGADRDINGAAQTRAQRRKAAAAAAARKRLSSTAERIHNKADERSEREERGPEALWKLWYDRSHQQQDGQQQCQWNRRTWLQELRGERQSLVNHRQACQRLHQQQHQECRQKQVRKQQQQLHKQQQPWQLQQTKDTVNSICRLSRDPHTSIVAIGEQQQQRALQQVEQPQQTVQPMEKSQQFYVQQELLQQLHHQALHCHQQHPLRRSASQKSQVEVSAASCLLGALLNVCASGGTSLQRQLLLRCDARQGLMPQERQPRGSELAAGAAELTNHDSVHRAQGTEKGTTLQTEQQQQRRCLGVVHRCAVLPELVDQRTSAFVPVAPTLHRQQGTEALSPAVNIGGQEGQQRQHQQQIPLAPGISVQQVQHLQHPERQHARRTAATMGRGEPAAVVADHYLVGAAAAESEDIYGNRATVAPPSELSSDAGAAAGRRDTSSAAAACRHDHSAAGAFGSTSRCGMTTALAEYDIDLAAVDRDYSAAPAERDVGALVLARNYQIPPVAGRAVANVQPATAATIHRGAAAAAPSRRRYVDVVPTHEKTALGAAAVVKDGNAAAVASGEGDTAVSIRRQDRPGAAARYATEIRGAVRNADAVTRCAYQCQTAEAVAGKCEEAAARREKAATAALKSRPALLAECLAPYQSGRTARMDDSGSTRLGAAAAALQCDSTAGSPANSNSKRETVPCCQTSTVADIPYGIAETAAQAPQPTGGFPMPLEHHAAASSLYAQPQNLPTYCRETLLQQYQLQQYQLQQYQLQQQQPVDPSSRAAGQQADVQQERSRRDALQQLLHEHRQLQPNLVPGMRLEPQRQEPRPFHSKFQQQVQQECWTERAQQQQQQPQIKLLDVQRQVLRAWMKLTGGQVQMTGQQIEALMNYASVLAQLQSLQEREQRAQRQAQHLNAWGADSTRRGAVTRQRISSQGFHTVPAAAAALQTHGRRASALVHTDDYIMQSMFLERQQQQERGGATHQGLDFSLTTPRRHNRPLDTGATVSAADMQVNARHAALRDVTPCCSPVDDSDFTGVSRSCSSSKCRSRGRRRKESRRRKSHRNARTGSCLNSRNRRCRCANKIRSMVCTSKRRSNKIRQPSKSNTRSPESMASGRLSKRGEKPCRGRSSSGSGKRKDFQVPPGRDNIAAGISAAVRRTRRNSSSRVNCRENRRSVKEEQHKNLKCEELSECPVLKQMSLAASGICEDVIVAATARAGGSSFKNTGPTTPACAVRASLMGGIGSEETAEGQLGMASARRRPFATEINVSTGDGVTPRHETWKLKSTRHAVAGAGHQWGGAEAATTRDKPNLAAPTEAAEDSAGGRTIGSLFRLQQGSIPRSSSKDSSNRSPSGGHRRSTSKELQGMLPSEEKQHIRRQVLPLQEHYCFMSPPYYSSVLHACAAVCNAFHIAPAALLQEAARAAARATAKKALATAASASNPLTSTVGANEHSAVGLAMRGADVSGGGMSATATASVRFAAPEAAVAAQNAKKRPVGTTEAEVQGYTAAECEQAAGTVRRAPGIVEFSRAAPALTWSSTAERKGGIRLVCRHSSAPSRPQQLGVHGVEQRVPAAGLRCSSFPRRHQQFSRNNRSSIANSSNESCRRRDSCGRSVWQQQRHRAIEGTISTGHKCAAAAVPAACLSNATDSVRRGSIRGVQSYVAAALPLSIPSSGLFHAGASGSSLEDSDKGPSTCALSAAKASTVAPSAADPPCHSVNAAAGAPVGAAAVDAPRISRWGPAGPARENEDADDSLLPSQLPARAGLRAAAAVAAATARDYGEPCVDRCCSRVGSDHVAPLPRADTTGKEVLFCISPSVAAATLAKSSSASLATPGSHPARGISAAPAAYQRLLANAELREDCCERDEKRGVATHDNMNGEARELLMQQLQPHLQLPLHRRTEAPGTANPPLHIEQQLWNPQTKQRQEMSGENCTKTIPMMLKAHHVQRQSAQQYSKLRDAHPEHPQQVACPLETWRQQQCELSNRLQQQHDEGKRNRAVKLTESHIPQGRLQGQTVHGDHLQDKTLQQQDNQHLSQRDRQQLKILCTLLTRQQQQESRKIETIATQVVTSTEGRETLEKDQYQQIVQPDIQRQRQLLCAGKELLQDPHRWHQLLMRWHHVQQQQRQLGRSGLQQAIPQPQQQAIPQPQQQALTHQQQALTHQQQALTHQQQALTYQQQALTQQQQENTRHPGAQFRRLRELQTQHIPAAAGIAHPQKRLDASLLPYLHRPEVLQQQNGQLKRNIASQSCTQKVMQRSPLFHINEALSLPAEEQQQPHPRQERMARTGVQEVLLRSQEPSLLPQMQQQLLCAVIPDHHLQQQLLFPEFHQHVPRQQQLLLPTTEQPRTLPQQQTPQRQLQQPLQSRSGTLQQLRTAACLLQQASAQHHLAQQSRVEEQRQPQQIDVQPNQQVKLSVHSQQQQQQHALEGHKCLPIVSSGAHDQLHELHKLEHLRKLQQPQTNAAARTRQEHLPWIDEQHEQPHFFFQQHHVAYHGANHAASAGQRISNQQGRKVSSQ